MTNVAQTGNSSKPELDHHNQQQVYSTSSSSTGLESSSSSPQTTSPTAQDKKQDPSPQPESTHGDAMMELDNNPRMPSPHGTQSINPRKDHRPLYHHQDGGPDRRESPRQPTPLITSVTGLILDSSIDHGASTAFPDSSRLASRKRSVPINLDEEKSHPRINTDEANKPSRNPELSLYTAGSSRSLAFAGAPGDPRELICLCTKAPKVPRPRNGVYYLFFFFFFFFHISLLFLFPCLFFLSWIFHAFSLLLSFDSLVS